MYTEGGVEDGEDDDMQLQQKLQDPFSYEELSMALMCASRIKGNDIYDWSTVSARLILNTHIV